MGRSSTGMEQEFSRGRRPGREVLGRKATQRCSNVSLLPRNKLLTLEVAKWRSIAKQDVGNQDLTPPGA